jgi:exopolysaccharide biosynthesis polyprenyl glycosylphosphotransferase
MSRASGRALQPSEHRVLLGVGDLFAASLATVVSIWIWSITAGFPFDTAFLRAHAAWLLAGPAWMLALLSSHGRRTALSARATVAALVRGMGVLLALYLALYFYLPPRALPRLVALYILWEGALTLLAWRLWYAWFFGRAEFLPRVLVVGSGERAETALRLLREFHPGGGVAVGVVDHAPEGSGGAMQEAVEASLAAEIVVATPAQPEDAFLDALLQYQERGIRIVTFAQLYEDTLQRVPIRHIDREWLLASFAEAIHLRDASGIVKRALDLAGAAAGLVVLAAVAPFVAAAIWLEDGRPILYRQARVGRAGSLFRILKFRTMVRDAENGEGPRWASPDDPRVTRAGRVLRRARLDELPNLVNVLRGDMSLVGPRPERPELVEMLEQRVPFYRTRLMARPGLTGWAQVNRPYDETIADASEKLEYDLYYLKHRTLLFDLQILIRTVGTVLGLKGR